MLPVRLPNHTAVASCRLPPGALAPMNHASVVWSVVPVLPKIVWPRDRGIATGAAGDDVSEEVRLAVGDVGGERLLAGVVGLIDDDLAVGRHDLLHHERRVVHAVVGDRRHHRGHGLGVLLVGAERLAEDWGRRCCPS